MSLQYKGRMLRPGEVIMPGRGPTVDVYILISLKTTISRFRISISNW